MTVQVAQEFADKYTGQLYRVGDAIDISDTTRLADLTARGLVLGVVEDKPSAPKTTKKRSSKS